MRQDINETKPTYIQTFEMAETLADANLTPDGVTYDSYTPDDWGVKRESQAFIRDNQLVMVMSKRAEPKTFKNDKNQHVRWHDTAWVRQLDVALIDEGAVEVTAKIPMIYPGFWPCAWLMHKKRNDGTTPLGEIDFVEAWGPLGSNPNPKAVGYPGRYTASVHYDTHTHVGSSSKVSPISSYDLSKEFHKYGVIKTREEIIFYLDDIEIHRVNRSSNPDQWDLAFPKGSPMYLLFSIQAGSKWYGLPNESTPDRLEMVIDEIKIWDFNS